VLGLGVFDLVMADAVFAGDEFAAVGVNVDHADGAASVVVAVSLGIAK